MRKDYDWTIIWHVEEPDIGNYANPKYYWHYSSQQVADWLKQAGRAAGRSQARSLYKNVQQQLADDAANLWVYAPSSSPCSRKGWQGFQVPGISPSMYLADLSFS